MRQLTAKQKKLLREWYQNAEPSQEAKMLFGSVNHLRSWGDLSLEQIESLESINDTEVLSHAVNAFLHDLHMSGV